MTPLTQTQARDALNQTLATLMPPGEPIPSLHTDRTSDPAWPCNLVAPHQLELAAREVGVDPLSLQAEPIGPESVPETLEDGTFANLSLMGDPSALNHNVCFLVASGTTFVMQTFLGQAVPLVVALPTDAFLTAWRALGTKGWRAAYVTLFQADVDEALGDHPSPEVFPSTQYLTVV